MSALFGDDPALMLELYVFPDTNADGIEIELRMNNKEKPYYDFMLDYLERVNINGKKKKIIDDVVTIYKNKGDTSKLRMIKNGDKVTYQLKTSILRDLEIFKDYGIRLSIAEEKKVTKRKTTDTVKLTRTRHRTKYSFVDKQVVFDLTEVTTNEDGRITMSYEVEVEFANIDVLKKYINHAISLLQYGSVMPHNQSYVFDRINGDIFGHSTLDNAKSERIRNHDLVQASDLHIDNLRDGRIISGGNYYYATTKIDGLRGLLIQVNNQWMLLRTPNILSLIISGDPGENNDFRVFDVEIYIDDNVTTIFPFDCLYDNFNLINDSYENRLRHLRKFPEDTSIFKFVTKEIYPMPSPKAFRQEVKKLLDSTALSAYKNDGLIFTRNSNYNNKTNRPGYRGMPDVLKWKPLEKLTIDLLYKGNKYYMNSDDGELKVFVGTPQMKFVPPRNPPLEGQIIEISSTPTQSVIHRVRYDKSKPNSEFVVISAWKLMIDPITRQDILSENLKLVYKHHNRVKKEMFQNNKGKILVDVGSGRGGDLNKFLKCYQKIICVEPNKDNIEHFESRLAMYPAIDKIKVTLLPWKIQNTNSKLTAKILEQTEGEEISVLSFMFSLSFCYKYAKDLIDRLNPKKVLFYTQESTIFDSYDKEEFSILNATFKKIGTDKLNVNIDSTIVDNYTEDLVSIRYLQRELSEHYTLKLHFGKSRDSFFTSDQQQFANMYVSGEFIHKRETVAKKEFIHFGPVDVYTKIADRRDLITAIDPELDAKGNKIEAMSRTIYRLCLKVTGMRARDTKARYESEVQDSPRNLMDRAAVLSEIFGREIVIVENNNVVHYSTKDKLYFYRIPEVLTNNADYERIYLMILP